MLDDLATDILRVLSSPDIDVRRKCLNIAMELTVSRNVDEVVAVLKKELVKTHDQDYEKVRFILFVCLYMCFVDVDDEGCKSDLILRQFLNL